MTLVQLKHLIALAEHRSFSKAADAVCLTQPAFSRSIRALEEDLGGPLFDRLGWRCEPTLLCKLVLDQAKALSGSAEDLAERARLISAGVAGKLPIGLGSGPGAMLMTPLLRHVAVEQPQLCMDITRGTAESLIQALRDRILEAVVLDTRSVPMAADLQSEWLCNMQAEFMCRPGHPLLSAPQPLTIQDVSRYTVACTPLADEVARLLVACYGAEAHPDRLVKLRCSEIGSLVEVTAQSDAVLLAIRAAAPELCVLQLTPPLTSQASFSWVTLAGRSLSPGLKVVRDLVGRWLHD
jgi:DNA-binding transcriptional LysR family regulator